MSVLGSEMPQTASAAGRQSCASGECRSPRREAYQNPACWLMVDLHALGWDEGENLHIEVRHANGDPTRLPRHAAAVEMNEEQHVVGHQPSQRENLDSEEVGCRQQREVSLNEFRPGGRMFAFRRRW